MSGFRRVVRALREQDTSARDTERLVTAARAVLADITQMAKNSYAVRGLFSDDVWRRGNCDDFMLAKRLRDALKAFE